MAKTIKIGGRLESVETGNIVAGANQIIDDAKNKRQSVINGEVDAELVRLDETKQGNLTFDNAPTEDSNNPVKSGGVYAADKLLSDAIEAILLLIPSAASALNKLVDMQTMNSSIATATATFRGTYNVVSDLELAYNATHEQIAAKLDEVITTADNNDYAFVQIPVSATSQDIAKTERYKFNGEAWAYEYDLNNSGFTQAQWDAINSTITAALVSKLSALPTATDLQTALNGKQDNLTFDLTPVSGSQNPVTSGGVYARNAEIVALITALDTAKQDKLTFDSTPTQNSGNPVTSNGVYVAVSALQAAIVALDAAKQNVLTFDSTPTLGSNNPVTSSGIKTQLNRIDGDIVTLNNLYQALTQSALVVVAPTDTWPVSNPNTTTIYRVVDRVNTPPQYYSDYMWNGTTMVQMAQYDNAIDDLPTFGSNNLVKSGGVYDAIYMNEIHMTPNTYVKTNGTTVNTTQISFNGYNSAVLDCVEGDKFTVFGKGVGLCALYCFIDSSGNKLELKQKTNKPIIITAPANASKVVFNVDVEDSAGWFFHKGADDSVAIGNTDVAIADITANTPVQLKHGFRVDTGVTVVNPTPSFYDGFACAVLNCSEGDKFTVWGEGGNTGALYCFIDSSGNKLSFVIEVLTPTIIVAPANTAKVVFNVIELNDADYGFYHGAFTRLELASIIGFNTKWQGKTIFTFGDSITWYDGHEFPSDHSDYGKVAVGYQSYMRQLGCNVVNYGESGYRMPVILSQIKGVSFTDCDCVTITCGANDFRATTEEPLGEIAPVGSQFDETTFIGSLQAAIEWLIAAKPSLRIFLITPIKGFLADGRVMPEAYAQAFINVSKLYSLPVCDWYNEVGINTLNKTTFIGDDAAETGYYLHPTNAGFELMGRTITGFLNNR